MKKILKNNNNLLICSIVLLIASIGFFLGSSYFDSINKEETPLNYRDLIKKGEDKSEDYVSINIASVPYLFAAEDDSDLKSYFVFDKDDYMYIVRLTDETYKKIRRLYNEDDNFSYILTGYLFNVPDELKILAITTYNEQNNKKILTNNNYKKYLGSTYLDEISKPMTTSAIILLCMGFLTDAFALIVFVGYIVSKVNYRKAKKMYNLDELDMELQKSTTIKYEKEQVYLTDKYIISNFMGLKVLEYKDIIWMYNENRKYNGITIGIFLLAYNFK